MIFHQHGLVLILCAHNMGVDREVRNEESGMEEG